LTQANSTTGIIQEQYDVSANFNDRLNFRRFLEYLSAELEQWILRLLRMLDDGSIDSDDTFQMVITRLATFISNNEALGSSLCGKARFQCQHIMMNLINECVLEDFPMGVPKLPVIGFGGAYGAQLLRPTTFDPANPIMVEKVMQDLLTKYNQCSSTDLKILGLRKVVSSSGSETVVVLVNGRPLTTCDPEHGCCISYYY
jgi:hypothetical protein